MDTTDPEDRTETRTTAATLKLPGFNVIGPLGEGAMGTVYLAEDATLHRRVAIKLVSPALASDREARQRFLREARAMASVEHPHVVRIYGFGESDATPYLVMEFVEGENLRDRIARVGKLAPREALTIADEIADGLEAAAASGIVHRDVKPSNVLFDRAGRARVADFGLARPVAGADSSLTGTGSFVGTPHYVSPEQARGEPLDHRSDIYSLGIVFFEMLTGEKPFPGSSPMMVVGKHLHEPLPSLRQVLPGLPDGVVELVEAMTSKDPAFRPSTCAELRARIRSVAASMADGPVRHRGHAHRAVWAAAAVALVAVVVAAVLWSKSHARPSPLSPAVQIDKLTNRGTADEAALSLDGRYLAFTADGLWVRDLREKTETRIRIAGDADRMSLVGMAADGSYIHYTVRPPDHAESQLFRVPLIGGTPQFLIEGRSFTPSPNRSRLLGIKGSDLVALDADGSHPSRITAADSDLHAFAWTPDGQRVLVVRGGSLFEIDLSNGKEEKRADLPNLSTTEVTLRPRPNGDVVALLARKRGEAKHSLHVVDLQTGRRELLGRGTWENAPRLEWLPDGSALVVNRALQLSLVSYPGGSSREITRNTGESVAYVLYGVTASGGSLLVGQSQSRTDLVVSDATDPSRYRNVAVVMSGIGGSLSWTPGGEIVYSSNETGTSADLYVLNPDSGARRQLTFDPSTSEIEPAVSPDGRYVVFFAMSDRYSLQRVNLDGTGLVQLVALPKRQLFPRPEISPDSRWVLYFDQSGPEGQPVLKRVSMAGGEPVIVKGSGENDPRPWELGFGGGWSNRGSEIAFLHWSVPPEGQTTPVEIVVASVEGTIRRRFPYTPDRHSWQWEHQKVQWSGEGPDRYLYFTRDYQLWRQPVTGGPATQQTPFDDIWDFDWSRDGKRLALSRTTDLRDIVLLSGYR